MKAHKPSALLFNTCSVVAVSGAAVGCGVIAASSLGLVTNAETLGLILCAAFPMIVGIVGMLIHGDAA